MTNPIKEAAYAKVEIAKEVLAAAEARYAKARTARLALNPEWVPPVSSRIDIAALKKTTPVFPEPTDEQIAADNEVRAATEVLTEARTEAERLWAEYKKL